MAEKILIVDDEEITRLINQEILSEQGFEVHLAEDGQAAWNRIESAPDQFDLILLDKHMPRLSGMDFLKRLKADAWAEDVPVIMLTADNRQQDIVEGLKAGAHYYLTKPSTPEMLIQVVRNALQELHHKRDLRILTGRHAMGLRSMHRAEFTLRTIDEAKSLAAVLADASHNPVRTVDGYAELLINAIEHGNLGITYEEKSRLLAEGTGRWMEEVERRLALPPYCDRKACVLLARHGEGYTITISDQGEGFDWRKYLEFDPERAFDLHGRGIAMTKAYSTDDIRYVGNGNTVILSYFPQHAERSQEDEEGE